MGEFATFLSVLTLSVGAAACGSAAAAVRTTTPTAVPTTTTVATSAPRLNLSLPASTPPFLYAQSNGWSALVIHGKVADEIPPPATILPKTGVSS